MNRVNIHDIKANLSRYLEQLGSDETLIICKRNVPIAELRRLPREPPQPRPVGLARGRFEVPQGFFEPLPDSVLRAFGGEES